MEELHFRWLVVLNISVNKGNRKNLNIVNIKGLVISHVSFPCRSLLTLCYETQQSALNYFLVNQKGLEIVSCGEWFSLECLQAPRLFVCVSLGRHTGKKQQQQKKTHIKPFRGQSSHKIVSLARVTICMIETFICIINIIFYQEFSEAQECLLLF